eukprot:CAMPEP_0185738906 /NCGR_PEP_ID=MMETSP1171-20130828/34127_1 /TAXON_ID=374046 /ORGANISM="Helicotheca tamensis, Strain CCMP826" /LENGTH=480 /DNA_ID=CAMNT_0028410291 /DNA_START=51 /DNA_END=1493 /DNA_ORIENTATION=-
MTENEQENGTAAAETAVEAATSPGAKDDGHWDADQLQHHDKPGEKKTEDEEEKPHGMLHMPHPHLPHAISIKRLGRKGKGKADPLDWGLPGELTKEEVDVFMKFRDIVEERGGEFRNTIYSFGEEEGEAYTLCRWLRARKFKLEDVVTMVEEATEVRKDARMHDFYPDPEAALGADVAVFMSLYPQCYSGVAKTGAPVFYSKPGVLNVDGMECITTLDGILKFHWYVMLHDYANRLREQKAKNPEFCRFECVSVIDLDHLTTAQLSQRALNIIKTQTAIDSVCFPETMQKMIIINAPRFFSLSWKVIKGWIDPRTASKVEIISSRHAWEKRMLELIDADQLPSDYGGKGEDTHVTLMSNVTADVNKLYTELMHLRSHASHTFDVEDGEEIEIRIFTRGTTGGIFSIVDGATKKGGKTYVEGVEIQHVGPTDENTPPTSVLLTESTGMISGPGKVKVRADSKGGRFGSENYLIVAKVYKKH